MLTRRVFLGSAAAAVRLGAFQVSGVSDVMKQKAAVLARVWPPQFPTAIFDVVEFGAAEGKESGDAIAKAIAACSQAGGGTVLVPKATFLTGPIHLKSNVNLH